MREAVIVSYARTGLAKSGRGGFNITPPMSMAAHAIKHAVERSGVEADFVEDCYMGNNAHGAANIGRQAALLAGMPVTTGGVTVNRFCSSGLQTIAMAANHIRGDGADCVVAGGVESISIPGGGMPREAIDPESTGTRSASESASIPEIMCWKDSRWIAMSIASVLLIRDAVRLPDSCRKRFAPR